MYMKAAEEGHDFAKVLFGSDMNRTTTGPSDLFRRALESEDTKVLMKLAKIYQKSPIKLSQAKKLVEKVVELSSPSSKD
eukprot:38589-Eustigmatos_ZCMA.PRE.1